MQKITPFLWFNGQAEEAAEFYTSIFKNSRVLEVTRLEGAPESAGNALTVSFELEGQAFTALNGGPEYTFSPAISFYVSCETQAEIDDLWDRLSAGGAVVECGWLTDRYGVSWQIVPAVLSRLLSDPDRHKAQRVMQALLQMKKLDLAALQRAYDQG